MSHLYIIHNTYAQIVIYKVTTIGNNREDITLQLLGFYDIVQPHLLCFSPKDYTVKGDRERECVYVCVHFYDIVIAHSLLTPYLS